MFVFTKKTIRRINQEQDLKCVRTIKKVFYSENREKTHVLIFRQLRKKTKKKIKKNNKKRYNVLKNSVPLHRFNKQLIVLQV